MIVDIHTHIFPPHFIQQRDRLVQHDPKFGEMYSHKRATMASAEDLRESMREAAIDVSVACGFWWSDPELAEEHAAYLGDVAAQSDGRIVAFGPSFDASQRCAGIGEVRLEQPSAFPGTDRPVLVHCSEEVGHLYPGKAGGLAAGSLWRLIEERPDLRVIAAHWGAGLPFYALMPEVARVIEQDRILFDTAATRYLYDASIFARVIDLVGARRIAWGSDYPLRSQAVDLAEVRHALRTDAEREAVLGGNAVRFLGLEAATAGGRPSIGSG